MALNINDRSEKDQKLSEDKEEEFVEDEEVRNTYDLFPSYTNSFQSSKINKILETVINSNLNVDSVYSTEACSKWTKDIADQTKSAVRGLKLKNYKICVVVTISQKKDQAMSMGCQSIMDEKTDGWAFKVFENVSDALVPTTQQ